MPFHLRTSNYISETSPWRELTRVLTTEGVNDLCLGVTLKDFPFSLPSLVLSFAEGDMS